MINAGSVVELTDRDLEDLRRAKTFLACLEVFALGGGGLAGIGWSDHGTAWVREAYNNVKA